MKALIIGGGIAGYTTALSLQKFGIECEIFETREKTAGDGAGIWLAPNGLSVLHSIDDTLINSLKNQGKQVNKFGVITTEKENLSIIDMKYIEQEFGNRHITIHRQALLRILEKKITSPIHFSKKFKSLNYANKQCTVFFDDDTQATGDLVIACDGIRSKVRDFYFDQVTYRDSQQICWRAIVNYKVQKDYEKCFYEMWSTKEGGLRVGYSPINDNEIYIFLTQKKEHLQNHQNTKEYLTNTFTEFPYHISDIIKLSNETDWIKKDLNDFQPIDYWHKNNVVLVGDSAHATTPNLGQGGNQAIESAFVIAQSLATTNTIQEGFKQYQQIRKPIADKITETSFSMAKLVNLEPSFFKNSLLWLLKNIPKNFIKKNLKSQYQPTYL